MEIVSFSHNIALILLNFINNGKASVICEMLVLDSNYHCSSHVTFS